MCYSTPRRYWERVCWYKTRIFLCDKPTYGTYQLAAKFQPSTVSPCSANELVTTYAYGRIESHSDQILTGADLACFVICFFDWDTILLTKSFICCVNSLSTKRDQRRNWIKRTDGVEAFFGQVLDPLVPWKKLGVVFLKSLVEMIQVDEHIFFRWVKRHEWWYNLANKLRSNIVG